MKSIFFSAFFDELEKLSTTVPTATPGQPPSQAMSPSVKPPSSPAMGRQPQAGLSSFSGQMSPLTGSISGLPAAGAS